MEISSTLASLTRGVRHSQVQTTARCAHLGQNSVKVAAAKIPDSLKADTDTPPGKAPTHPLARIGPTVDRPALRHYPLSTHFEADAVVFVWKAHKRPGKQTLGRTERKSFVKTLYPQI